MNFYVNAYLIDVGYMVRQYQIRMEAIAALDMASKSKQYFSLSSLYSSSQPGLVAWVKMLANSRHLLRPKIFSSKNMRRTIPNSS